MPELTEVKSDTRAAPNTVMPSVSVIIPAFNDQAGVNVCLDGIATQSYPLALIEVIVVDNGSTPPLTVKKGYSFSARMLQCATRGSYAARNTGAHAATTDVLVFTDADCAPDSDWLAAGVRRLLGGTGNWIVGGDVAFLEPERRTATALYQIATGFGQQDNIENKYFTATANLFCTVQHFRKVGQFDERLLSGGDREWCWRACHNGIGVQYEPTSIVHTHARSTLLSALRQARRVAAGRQMLRDLGLTHVGANALARKRSAWQSLAFIFGRDELTLFARLRISCVAIVIRIAYALERLRLRLGAAPERR